MPRAIGIIALIVLAGNWSPVGAVDPPMAAWLVGKWDFDQQKSSKAYAETRAGGLFSGLVERIAVAEFFAAMKGGRMVVGPKEIAMTMGDGNGKALAYEVIDVPDADTLTVRYPDGQVFGFHREGDWAWLATGPPGTLVGIRVYWSRAK